MAEKRIHHAAVHQAEIAGVQWDFGVGKLADEAVEIFRGPELEGGFAFALGAHAVDHVVAVHPLIDEIENHFGRILEIGVNDRDGVTGGVLDAGGDGHLMAEIAGEAHDADARIAAFADRAEFRRWNRCCRRPRR